MKRYIIPLFIPHDGCPHQCVFCDQRTITGVTNRIGADEVKAIIDEHRRAITLPREVEIAFYGGSFTALPVSRQVELLAAAKMALESGLVQFIRISTRPDSIDEPTVKRLLFYGVSTVELGVQSLDNNVLDRAGRGHDSKCVEAAVEIIKNNGIKCGIQLMPGLPGEDWKSLIGTGTGTVKLKPDFVRVYPTVVIAGTPLARLYQAGLYRPLTLQEAVAKAAYLKILFDNSDIPVIRYGLQATENLSRTGTVLAGPYHPAFGELVASFVFNLMVCQGIENISVCPSASLTIHYHAKDHSKLRGTSNHNIEKWHSRYGIKNIKLAPDWKYNGEIVLSYQGINYIINPKMTSIC